MRNYKIFIVIALFAFAFSSCYNSTVRKNEEVNKTDSSEKSIAADEKKQISRSVEETETSDDVSKADMNPTETYRAYNKAVRSKNVKKEKELLSKDSVTMLEKLAKKQKTSIGDLLTVNLNESEIRNQKIEGNTATVEIKNEILEKYDEMPLVKEDGLWKIALDKFMKNMLENINKNQKQAPESAK